MEWLKQLSQAIDYIENTLDGDISYETAAKIACCSTYYFQRMFSYVTGVSLSEYIRRRRMTQAAFDISATQDKIMDIGMKYGYASPASFNRAFQSVHGVSPNTARREGIRLNAYPRIRLSIAVTGDESMKYRIETTAPIRIVGVKVSLESNLEQNFKIIPAFWDSVMKQNKLPYICRLAEKEPGELLGVSDYENPCNINYYIGIAAKEPVPDGMASFEIPAATWVIFECEGSYPDSVQNAYKRFFTEWLPFSGYECCKCVDMEVYKTKNPDLKKLKEGKTELWIAIKKIE